MAKTKAKGRKQAKRRLTARQKAFVALFPAITAGKMTVEAALKAAGYSDSTAKQQTRTVEAVRNSSAMQEALRKAGVTEQRVAEKVGWGIAANGPVGLGYTKLAAELLDAFPSKKFEDVTPPKTYGDLEGKPKAKTIEQARKLAEEADDFGDQ